MRCNNACHHGRQLVQGAVAVLYCSAFITDKQHALFLVSASGLCSSMEVTLSSVEQAVVARYPTGATLDELRAHLSTTPQGTNFWESEGTEVTLMIWQILMALW